MKIKTPVRIATALAVASSVLLCLVAWKSQDWEDCTITNKDGVVSPAMRLVETEHQDPTVHFEWMPKLYPDDYHEPEWNCIKFGNNHVPWLTFRRGIYGNYWNGWEAAPATALNAVILQSSFEPVVTKTSGVWLITFKR